MIDLECKKMHLAIAYHKMRECIAAGIINPVKILTYHNISDSLQSRLSGVQTITMLVHSSVDGRLALGLI